ncbi:MAG TPA: hypothetical protein VN040_16075 [Pseudosphingobacterium sp.]|nr:hypothetical protein [Pseudosphingobacterium sp.]
MLIRGLLCLSQPNYTYKFNKTTNHHVFAAEALQVRFRLEPAVKAILIFNCRSDNRLAEKGEDKK